MRVLVTGATGFLGRAIVAAGARAGHDMVAASRVGERVAGAREILATGDLAGGIGAMQDGGALAEVDALIHCAARVHVMRRETGADAEAIYRVVNADLPVALAKAARGAGVGRFVQISSVAAIASQTPPGTTLDDSATPAPTTPYGRTKLDADQRLAKLVDDEFAVISLRPPAIYGPGVGAFFALIARAAKAGVPLPLGALTNARSFAFVDNIAEATIAATAMTQSSAYVVTDSAPVSTTQLYRELLELSGHSAARCFALPTPLLRWPARAVLGERAHSLLGDAAFDGTRFMQASGWSPRVSRRDALRATMTSFAAPSSSALKVALL